MKKVLEKEFSESPLGYDNVDWFEDEVKKMEEKMSRCFKNTN